MPDNIDINTSTTATTIPVATLDVGGIQHEKVIVEHLVGGEGGSHRHEKKYEDERRDRIKKRVEEDNRFIVEFLKTATDIINNQ